MGPCSIRILFINTNKQTACLFICLLNKDSGAALIGLLFINRPVYKHKVGFWVTQNFGYPKSNNILGTPHQNTQNACRQFS